MYAFGTPPPDIICECYAMGKNYNYLQDYSQLMDFYSPLILDRIFLSLNLPLNSKPGEICRLLMHVGWDLKMAKFEVPLLVPFSRIMNSGTRE